MAEYSSNKEEQDKADSILSLLFLISNVLCIPVCIIVGYLIDKFRMWKVMVITSVLTLLFNVLLVIYINDISFAQNLAFVCTNTFNIAFYLVVSKIPSPSALKSCIEYNYAE